MSARDAETFDVDPRALDEVSADAERVGRGALAAGLQLRLMGGVAIYLTSPTVRRAPYARPYGDFDLAVAKNDVRRATAFLEAAGYVPEKMFNALHGADRLNFQRRDGRWTIDVVVDQVEMSHRIDLRGRLAGPALTLTLADLLLTKLQIWEINSKDLGDMVCLLADHDIADREDPVTIDRRRILSVGTADWGFCHTIERNLRGVIEEVAHRAPADPPRDPVAQAEGLLRALETAPKSIAWRARARIGERVRWYETPEEVRH